MLSSFSFGRIYIIHKSMNNVMWYFRGYFGGTSGGTLVVLQGRYFGSNLGGTLVAL